MTEKTLHLPTKLEVSEVRYTLTQRHIEGLKDVIYCTDDDYQTILKWALNHD